MVKRKINSHWVKYDKNNEILNESLSGEESGDENKEIKSNVDLIVNKDNANSVCSRSENKKRNEQKELIDNESELDLNNKNILCFIFSLLLFKISFIFFSSIFIILSFFSSFFSIFIFFFFVFYF